eukprot:TRINITY_DN16463_c0_g1_i10.p2 TRINITY_DN16463_c0_g1~~TRINITY_DN16463_c0_g1_i10.p2  ORF type:complete len:102 (-),score=15.95 TRINITY_DN16463_c0_g1_i10:104-409(-)
MGVVVVDVVLPQSISLIPLKVLRAMGVSLLLCVSAPTSQRSKRAIGELSSGFVVGVVLLSVCCAVCCLSSISVSYTHLRAHETPEHLVCRLLLEKKKKKIT